MTSKCVVINSWDVIRGSRDRSKSLELVHRLLAIHAVAIKLQEHFHQTECVVQPLGSILVPLDQALQRLISTRTVAGELGVKIRIFACTEARTAVAVTSDSNERDYKYLSGLVSWDGNHAYCGGLDAAIGRALLFAPHADVVCFKSPTASTSDARRFATAIRAEFPKKQLAFGYSPKPDGLRWNEMDHAKFRSELKTLGYDYYFLTQFGSSVFPQFPSETPWVVCDDLLRGTPLEH